ncbi:MAG TPA: DUF503 domain-containing protein [Thermomicrobiaceae bacterium]|nr:DUF503 domain-containing protein [Thermomicrobiaceae bacterium]
MVIGIAHLSIQIPGAQSLKDKRRVVKSLTQRLQNRFNVAVAEVDQLDAWQSAVVGLAVVSNSAAHADQMLSTILRFVEDDLRDGFLIDVHTEILHA